MEHEYDTRTIWVTPAIAERFLERNDANRKLSDALIQKYAALMRIGEWGRDGSPIRFDRNGRMIDGQHRCWAIIESGQPQPILVIRGLSTESFTTIDTGKKRSFADVLTVEYPGMGSVSHVAAATVIIHKWEKGVRRKGLSPSGGAANLLTQPSAQLLAFFRQHADEIEYASRLGRNYGSHRRGLTPATVALFVWITRRIDVEDSEFFLERLTDGAGLEAGHPILALRNFLTRYMAGKDVRGGVPVDLAMALLVKTWNAFRRGDSLQVLSFRMGGAHPEAYPEPE